MRINKMYIFLAIVMCGSWIGLRDGGEPVLAAERYYEGKTLRIIQDSTPGGIGELRTRALIPVFQKQIPGNPTIFIEFMPGGGGIRAHNYLYNVTPRDGLTIGRVSSGLPTNYVVGHPAVEYDMDKFIYLGSSLSQVTYAFFTMSRLGLDTLEKLRDASGLRVGGQSVGHTNYVSGRFFAWLLALKQPRFVTGYSGAELDIALEAGELDARSNAVESIIQRVPRFIDEELAHFHVVAEVPYGYRVDHPLFVKLPAMHEFASTKFEKKVVDLWTSLAQFSQSFALPPDVPSERVEILKSAFRKASKDPEFLDRWRKLTKSEASPLMPEEVENLIRGIPREPAVVEAYKTIAGPGPLPSR